MLDQYIPPRNAPYTPPPSTGTGIALISVGAVVLVVGVLVMLDQRRTAAPDPDEDTDRKSVRRATPFGTWLTGLGASVAAMGVILLLIRAWGFQSRTDGLHAAGQQLIDKSVLAAQECATEPSSAPIYIPGMDGLPGHYYTAPPCSTNPRDAAQSPSLATIVGAAVYSTQPTDSFATTGRIQVTDYDTKQSVCVTVPDTVSGTGAITDGPCSN